jgi:hypothetical protein
MNIMMQRLAIKHLRTYEQKVMSAEQTVSGKIILRNMKKFAIKRKLRREIGPNWDKLLERRRRNNQLMINYNENVSLLKLDMGDFYCLKHIAPKRNMKDPVHISNMMPIYSIIEDIKNNVPLNYKIRSHSRQAFFKIIRVLKYEPDFNVDDLWVGWSINAVFFRYCGDNVFKQFDPNLYSYKLREHMNEKYSKHPIIGSLKRTKFPMTNKGKLFTIISSGFRSRLIDNIGDTPIDQIPKSMLMKMVWVKFGKSFKDMRTGRRFVAFNPVWGRENYKYRPSRSSDPMSTDAINFCINWMRSKKMN